MHILIIGAGAVGSFLGARLALGGEDVVLAARPAQAERLWHTLALHEPTAPPRAAGVTVAAGIGEALALRDAYDLALVTVKAYDTASVVAELQAAGLPVPPLLSMQNGVGNEETLGAAFGAGRVIAGAIDTPVTAPSPGEVHVHRARYGVGVAPVGAGAPVDIALIAVRNAGMAAEPFSDYRGLKWSKLLMNLPANATCAILGWTPARVMADATVAELEARAWQEALAVMAGSGIVPVALGGYPLPAFALVARLLPAAWLGRILGRFVAGGRGTKLPSLALALAAGRPSEVQWLNGAVAEQGSRVRVAAPVNRLLWELLAGISAGSEAAAD